MGRLGKFAETLLAAWLVTAAASAGAADVAFQNWLGDLWPQAQALGVSRATFDAATRGIEPDLTLPDLDLPGREGAPPRGQAEFVQTPADYIKEANIARLAGEAKKLAAQHRDTLAAIEQQYGVPGNVLLAIWGRETAFGGYRLPKNAIAVLATWIGLAWVAFTAAMAGMTLGTLRFMFPNVLSEPPRSIIHVSAYPPPEAT